MVGKSLFEKTIEWDGSAWHLLYDPADDTSVMPDLSPGKITNMSCTEVRVPSMAEGAHYYMVIVDIEIPAVMRGNEVRPVKLLKGFRIYDYMPTNPTDVASLRLPEMVYYIKEPATIQVGGSVQDFLDTVLGGTIAEAERRTEVDRSWSRMLMPEDQTTMEGTIEPAEVHSSSTPQRADITSSSSARVQSKPRSIDGMARM